MPPPAASTVSRVLRSPQTIVLCAIVILSASLVGLSRYTVPRGLAPPEPLPAARDGYAQQFAGYVRIPSDGAYTVTVSGASAARLFVDGVAVSTFTARDQPMHLVPVSAGVHRVHVQFTRETPGDRAPHLSWSDGGSIAPVPPEALSPRAIAPAAWWGRPLLTPLTIGLVWLWFATGIWLAARPFFAWYRRQLSDDELLPVLGILALSVLLTGYGLSWGLPGGWAQDEIGTTDITGGVSQWFVGGWYHRYPPLHFYLLALVHLPLIVADRLDMTDFWSPTSLYAIGGISRGLTVAMSVATAALVYLIARTVLSVRIAALASLCWVLGLTVTFYGKLTNLDMPYTCWFAVSLLGYVRALTSNAVADYVLFAAGAAAAVCTKDQAYGLYVFPMVHLIVHRLRSARARADRQGLAGVLRDPALPTAAAVGLLGFVLLQAIPFNWRGVERHFLHITGGASGAYRMVDSGSLSGQAFLFRRTFDHLVWSLSWPGLLIGLVGLVYLLLRRRWKVVLALLLPAVSYYLTFIAVVGYSYDRFMIPVCLLLSIFAGAALDGAWPSDAPRWRTGAVATLLVYMALRTTSIDVMMAADGRYVVEAWVRSHVPAGTRIGVFEHQDVLPRLPEGAMMPFLKPLADLPVHQPEYLVLTDNYLTRVTDDSAERALYGRLLAGEENYDVVLQYQTKLPFAILALESRFRHPDGSFTTLHKVNPMVTVLHRRDRP